MSFAVIPSRRHRNFVFNSLGQIVINTQVSGTVSEVNTSRLSSGVYRIHVIANGQKIVKTSSKFWMIYVNGNEENTFTLSHVWTRPFRKRCVRNGAILAWCPCFAGNGLGRTGPIMVALPGKVSLFNFSLNPQLAAVSKGIPYLSGLRFGSHLSFSPK